MSQVKLSEFDLYGTFRLTKQQTAGIEDLVQKLNDNEYLSRNANYYPINIDYSTLNFDDICTEYARLNSMLPMSGKPAFVICEKMHELAIRAANTIQQKYRIHLFQDGEHFDTVAQKCAQECADNLVRLMHGQAAARTPTNIRQETRLRPDTLLDTRIIEADNKKQLYMCANALPDDVEHLITPGRGSSKLGTLVQAVRQQKGLKPLGITQIYYSLYRNSQQNKVFTRPLKNLPEKLLVMDDDIDTGRSIHRIKKELTEQGHQVTNGAITTTFHSDERGNKFDTRSLFFDKTNWANFIDIIPNQYADYSDQLYIRVHLKHCPQDKTSELTDFLNNPRNHDGHHTADYIAMKNAETMAHKLGADLYQVSEKISPAAVEYNKKFRDQVEQYNAELQDSLSR